MNKIGKLNGDEIDAKMVSGNFATDAFTTAAFSMRFFEYMIYYISQISDMNDLFLFVENSIF